MLQPLLRSPSLPRPFGRTLIDTPRHAFRTRFFSEDVPSHALLAAPSEKWLLPARRATHRGTVRPPFDRLTARFRGNRGLDRARGHYFPEIAASADLAAGQAGRA